MILNRKKVTIITPCYNSERYLPECLKSIEAQSMPMTDLEVILINDASEDSTWEIINSFEKKYPESVIAINLDYNMKQGGARNIALEYASGEYMMFFDSDDVLANNTCEWMYDTAVRYDLDILEGSYYQCKDIISDETVIGRTKASELTGLYDLSENGVRTAFLVDAPVSFGCCFKLYKMDMVNKVGSRFAEHVMYEEPKFVFPLFLTANKVGIADEIVSYRRLHSGSTMHANNGINHRLMEHPKVQLQLLFWLKQYPELYQPSREEIIYYFVFSFYFETILFSVRENKPISVYDYEWLRTVTMYEASDYMDNRFINSDNRLISLMKNLDKSFIKSGNTELDKFIAEIYDNFKDAMNFRG